MAKRHTFDEIINSDFRWPIAGDAPFVEADNPMDNAVIAKDDFTRLVLMIDGYKKAADIAVAQCAEHPADRDLLVYPIIFNYRQFIELSLKYQLATHGCPVGIEANWNTHRLERLWGDFAVMLDRYGTPDPDEADPIVASVVGQFAKIDPKSDAYRYPVDQRGNPLPVAFAATHLPNLADVMQAVAGYFSGCDGYLSDLRGAMP
jgi:hypothetical protein